MVQPPDVQDAASTTRAVLPAALQLLSARVAMGGALAISIAVGAIRGESALVPALVPFAPVLALVPAAVLLVLCVLSRERSATVYAFVGAALGLGGYLAWSSLTEPLQSPYALPHVTGWPNLLLRGATLGLLGFWLRTEKLLGSWFS